MSTAIHTYEEVEPSHHLVVGYVLWLFGFMGAHRFYYGKPITGTLWFCTLGLFFVGWIIDLLLIPRMNANATRTNISGPFDHTIAWILLTFLGVFGVHRFYLGKWLTGLLYFATGGLLLLGVLYDYWTLNDQVSDANLRY